MTCVDGPLLLGLGGLALAHHPQSVPGRYVVAGHLHPAAVVGGRGGDRLRLPCFHFGATVGVLPAQRGQGIGEALMRACEERLTMSHVRLNVRLTNTVAIRLYEKLGYRKTGTWPEYYEDGEDALVMEKVL